MSDPGYRLVAAAVAGGRAGHRGARPVRGDRPRWRSPGCPCDRFCFEGFLPRKAGERRRALDALADEQRTMVFFEAPHRLARDAGRDGRCVRRGPAGGGLPRADQDLRGGPARPARPSWPPGPRTGCAARSPSWSVGRRGGGPRQTRPLTSPTAVAPSGARPARDRRKAAIAAEVAHERRRCPRRVVYDACRGQQSGAGKPAMRAIT